MLSRMTSDQSLSLVLRPECVPVFHELHEVYIILESSLLNFCLLMYFHSKAFISWAATFPQSLLVFEFLKWLAEFYLSQLPAWFHMLSHLAYYVKVCSLTGILYEGT